MEVPEILKKVDKVEIEKMMGNISNDIMKSILLNYQTNLTTSLILKTHPELVNIQNDFGKS